MKGHAGAGMVAHVAALLVRRPDLRGIPTIGYIVTVGRLANV